MRTHCRNGHAMEGENVLYAKIRGKVYDICRECKRAGKARWRERERANRPPKAAAVPGAHPLGPNREVRPAPFDNLPADFYAGENVRVKPQGGTVHRPVTRTLGGVGNGYGV